MVNGRRTSGSFAQVATPFASLALFIPFEAANFRQTRLLRATQHSTAPTHVSIILPPSTDCHETIRRYVFNESRSIVRDCSVRLACGPNVGEEAHLPRSPSRGETYERKMGATRSVKRERERPYSYLSWKGAGKCARVLNRVFTPG